MNDCNELIPTTESRKKSRGSGFRFSSKRVLDRSRLKRLAKARGCEVTSVTRTLSYLSLIQVEVCASVGPSYQSPGLVTFDESEEDRKETSNVDHIKDSEYRKTVSSFRLFCLRLWNTQIFFSYSILTSTSVDIFSVIISMSLSIMYC